MDTLLFDLRSLAEEHFPAAPAPEEQECRQLLARHLSAVRAGMGGEFAEKLSDVGAEWGLLNRERAFLQGLRLGLALHRL